MFILLKLIYLLNKYIIVYIYNNKKNMINKVLFKYYFFAAITQDCKYDFCNSNSYQGTVILLKKPLLVCDYYLNDFDISKKQLVKDIIFNNIEKPEAPVLIGISNKDKEKKSKINSRLDNIEIKSDLKKNKIKLKRKQRNKLKLDSKDILFEQNFVSSIAQEDDKIDIGSTKSLKLSKSKKKYKIRKKINDISNQFNINLNQKLSQKDKLLDKEIILDKHLTVEELSEKLGIPEAAIITWLFLQGISVTINQVVDVEIATKVAEHYNFNVVNNPDINLFYNETKSNQFLSEVLNRNVQRPPIVTIFGHVDHGKTTLLDSILKTNLACQEVGGITQSIKGYEVEFEYLDKAEKIIFIDTPGHEAFTNMRLRGAEITDIALLVVAADDGLKKQTIESINYILKRKIPYIIVINKIDKTNLNLDNIKQQLAEYNIIDKTWGGDSTIVEVSALKSLNLNLLLSSICNMAKTQNLQANPQLCAQGNILDSYLDKKTGTVATLVIKDGTLKIGDIIIAGNLYGRVKNIVSSNGIKVSEALPSAVVDVWGFSINPKAGLKFSVVSDEKSAKSIISQNQKLYQDDFGISNVLNTRVTFDSCKEQKNVKIINVILKADTQGSIEAIINSFTNISQKKVQINIISTNCGFISSNDLELAITSKSIILGFNIGISSSLAQKVKKLDITMAIFDIIYGLLNYMHDYMLSFVNPEFDQQLIGKAKVQTVFKINRGLVAGCLVDYGKLKKGSKISIYRNQNLLHEGSIDSLKRLKDDVNEVLEGNECGVMCYSYQFWQSFDVIEAYELIEKPKVL
uniref:translation initiation factor 2 n=1 Tax=Hypnea wynnei TaxID=1867777 RepID=UPI0027DA865F|nr:translation initiation factor 2 [Hypnea wynnei]WCH56527.1 translation initiation factor 2 [Hypnea wynnei]